MFWGSLVLSVIDECGLVYKMLEKSEKIMSSPISSVILLELNFVIGGDRTDDGMSL